MRRVNTLACQRLRDCRAADLNPDTASSYPLMPRLATVVDVPNVASMADKSMVMAVPSSFSMRMVPTAMNRTMRAEPSDYAAH